MKIQEVKNFIRNIDNFPKKGILFKDITPILNNNLVFKTVIDSFVSLCKKFNFDVILTIESRGFLFASAVSYLLNKRLVIARKANKLPWKEKFKIKYNYEYSSGILEIQKGDIKKNDRVLILDDIIATGNTVKAVCDLLESKIFASVICCIFILKIENFNPEKLLGNIEIKTLL